MTPEQKAMRWLTRRDTGLSSEAILAHMIGGFQKDLFAAYPHDPADLGRCLRLLKAVPEWKPRIGEMKKYSCVWAALIARWSEIEASMRREVGIDWSKGRNAPKTYELMKSIIRPAEEQYWEKQRQKREKREAREAAAAKKAKKAKKRGGKK